MRTSVRAIEDPQWREFVASRPESTPFHRPEWASAIAECYGFEASALTVEDSAGDIVGGIPTIAVRGPFGHRRWVSLPFTDSCPILTAATERPALIAEALIDFVGSAGIGSWQVRAPLPEGDHVHLAKHGVIHVSRLPSDESALEAGLSKMHRRNVRTALRQGVEITHGTDEYMLREFLRLHSITRKRVGMPIQPRRFFELVRSRVLEAGMGWVSLAWAGDSVAAAAVFLVSGDTVIYKFGASDRAYSQSRANHLLFWDALRESLAQGRTIFEWGRSDSEAHGLREFKAGWGATETDLVYAEVAERAPHSSWNGALRLAGPVIRNSPIAVARLTGKLFYRWTA